MEKIEITDQDLNPSTLRQFASKYRGNEKIGIVVSKKIAASNINLHKIIKYLPNANVLIKDQFNEIYDGENNLKLSDFILKPTEIRKLVENYNQLKLRGNNLSFESGYSLKKASIAGHRISNWVQEVNGSEQSDFRLTPLEKFYRICAIAANSFYNPNGPKVKTAADLIDFLSGSKNFADGFNDIALALCETSNIPATKFPVIVNDNGNWVNKSLICARIADSKYNVNGIVFSDIEADCLKEKFPGKPTTFSCTAMTINDFLNVYGQNIILNSNVAHSSFGASDISDDSAKLFPLYKSEYERFLKAKHEELSELQSRAKTRLKHDKNFVNSINRLLSNFSILSIKSMIRMSGAVATPNAISTASCSQLIKKLILLVQKNNSYLYTARNQLNEILSGLLSSGMTVEKITAAAHSEIEKMDILEFFINTQSDLFDQMSRIERKYSYKQFDIDMESTFFNEASKTTKIGINQFKELLSNLGRARNYTPKMVDTYANFKYNSTLLSLMTNSHYRDSLGLPGSTLIQEAACTYPQIWNMYAASAHETPEQKAQKLDEIDKKIANKFELMAFSYKNAMNKLSDESYNKVKW